MKKMKKIVATLAALTVIATTAFAAEPCAALQSNPAGKAVEVSVRQICTENTACAQGEKDCAANQASALKVKGSTATKCSSDLVKVFFSEIEKNAPTRISIHKDLLGQIRSIPEWTCKAPAEKPEVTPPDAEQNGNQSENTGNNSSEKPGETPDTPDTPEVPSTPDAQPESVQSFEARVVELVNAERAKNGLSALTANASLANVARVKSQDMHDKKYFSHTSPTYGSPFDMMKRFGIQYNAAGENIAYGYATPEKVMDAWMNSPGHRANILNKAFTQIGVGYVTSGNYCTQMFIG